MGIASGVFITGTDTDVGKTLVSAVVAMALEYPYWKPVQAGIVPSTDAQTVRSLTRGAVEVIPEQYCLSRPLSPHKAAEIDAVQIAVSDFTVPTVPCVAEGAGGLLVPLNQHQTVADLASHLDLPCILVVRLRLGCINQTMLTLEAMKTRGLKCVGLIFTQDDEVHSKSSILTLTGLPCLLHVQDLADSYSADGVAELAKQLKTDLILRPQS